VIEGKPAGGRCGSRARLVPDGAPTGPRCPRWRPGGGVVPEEDADLGVVPKQGVERQLLMSASSSWCPKNLLPWCPIKVPKSYVPIFTCWCTRAATTCAVVTLTEARPARTWLSAPRCSSTSIGPVANPIVTWPAISGHRRHPGAATRTRHSQPCPRHCRLLAGR
jgi:hypothetical protein